MSRSDDHHLDGADVKPKDGGASAAGCRSDKSSRCRQARQVRWVLWLVCVISGYLVLHVVRPEVMGRPLGRLPVYVIQAGFFLAIIAERVTKASPRDRLPYATTLAAVCLFIEVAFAIDRQFIRLPATSADDSGYWPSDMLLEQFCYFGVLLPWAAGLAVGTLISSLWSARR